MRLKEFAKVIKDKTPPADQFEGFHIWTTNEERKVLKKLKDPVRFSNLEEEDQFRVETLIRKSLVTKIGMDDPFVVANGQTKQTD